MTKERVIKIKRVGASQDTDTESAFILLFARQTGPNPLDLDLIASEGNAAYGYSLQSNRAEKMKSKAFSGSKADWETLLASLIGPTQATRRLARPQDSVEIVAQVDESKIELRICEGVHGVVRQLGTITLKHNDALEEATNMFDWAAVAAQSVANLEAITAEATRAHARSHTQLVDLQAQVDRLIEEKQQSEQRQLFRTQQILNSYKMKIRDLSVLLSSASIDAKLARKVSQARQRQSRQHDTMKTSPDSKRSIHDLDDITSEFGGSEADGQDLIDEDEELTHTGDSSDRDSADEMPEVATPASMHQDGRQEMQIKVESQRTDPSKVTTAIRSLPGQNKPAIALMSSKPSHGHDEEAKEESEDEDDEL